MHRSSAVGMIGVSQTQKPSQSFVILGWAVHWRKMTATVERGKRDSIEAVGFAMITRSSWNERWSDDLAVEAITGEDSLKHEASSRSLIAGRTGPLSESRRKR